MFAVIPALPCYLEGNKAGLDWVLRGSSFVFCLMKFDNHSYNFSLLGRDSQLSADKVCNFAFWDVKLAGEIAENN
jgi:hypothetical protein